MNLILIQKMPKKFLKIEEIKFDSYSQEDIDKINFRGIENLDDFEDPKIDIESFTFQTKIAVDVLLNYRKDKQLDIKSIDETIETLISDLESSDNREEQFLGVNLRNQIKIKKLETMTTTDSLTGLNNRLFAEEKLKSLIHQLNRTGTQFSVIIIDIDHFKRINDNFGHDIGDQTLRGIAEIMQNNLRKSDVVARWGGEEFLIILEGTDSASATKKAEDLRKEIQINLGGYIKDASSENAKCINVLCKNRKECKKKGKLCLKEKITCSMGVATGKNYGILEQIEGLEKQVKRLKENSKFSKEKEIKKLEREIEELSKKVETPERIVKRADESLYVAKNSGRNKVISEECNGKPLCVGKKFVKKVKDILKKES